LVLYLLLQSEISGRPYRRSTSLAVYSPLDLPPAAIRDLASIGTNEVWPRLLLEEIR